MLVRFRFGSNGTQSSPLGRQDGAPSAVRRKHTKHTSMTNRKRNAFILGWRGSIGVEGMTLALVQSVNEE